MIKLAKTLLTLGGGLLCFDAYLMAKGKSNPIKGLPLPCPITLSLVGTGLVLFTLGNRTQECDCDCCCDDECCEL